MGERTIIYDTEADNLLRQATVVHCIATYCIEDDEYTLFGPLQIKQGLEYLCTATTLIAHNQCGYDLPLLYKLHKFELGKDVKIVDTLLVDCLLYPEVLSHSLDNVGKRIGAEQDKLEYYEWDKYDEAMGERCLTDVKLNLEIYEMHLTHSGYSSLLDGALDREQEFLWLHTHQAERGFKLNEREGVRLYRKLDTECTSLEKSITEGIPPVIKVPNLSLVKATKLREEIKERERVGGSVEGLLLLGLKSHKLDYTHTAATVKYFGEDVGTVVGPYNKLDLQRFNLNSPLQVQKYLLSCGWKPTTYNKKLVEGKWITTTPKLTEDSFSSIKGGLGEQIAEYNLVKHRRGMLLTYRKSGDRMSGILSNAHERGDECVSADGMTCSTNTSRTRHRVLVNLPSVERKYGKEIRGLLISRYKRGYLVGVDLDQVEARILVHYCMNYEGGDKFSDIVLSGDFHQSNADAWGVSRGVAKGGFYCLAYGGGGPKLAETLGKPKSQGQRLKDAFYKLNPCVKSLVEDLEKAYASTGSYIRGLDGRQIYIRSKHKLLNSLIQSAGAVVFKEWINLTDTRMKHGALQVLHYHDEGVWDVPDISCAEDVGSIIMQASLDAGVILGLKAPITSAASYGSSYAEVH